MATRRPIVLVSGVQAEMPRGDVIDTGLNVTLQANPSGLYFTGDNKLGFDGQGDNIQVIASGVGAVYRTVQDKGRDVVSVKDFGAVGDGVTNDTAAVQAALNASTNVFFPPGQYLVTSSLTIPGADDTVRDSYVISGASAKASKIIASNTFDVFRDSGTYPTRIIFKDLQIAAAGVSAISQTVGFGGGFTYNVETTTAASVTPPATVRSAIRLGIALNCGFKDLVITGFDCGVYIKGGYQNTFDRCRFDQCFYGVYLLDETSPNFKNLSFEFRNNFITNAIYGLYLTAPINCLMQGNIFEALLESHLLINAAYCKLSHEHIEVANQGIRFSGGFTVDYNTVSAVYTSTNASGFKTLNIATPAKIFVDTLPESSISGDVSKVETTINRSAAIINSQNFIKSGPLVYEYIIPLFSPVGVGQITFDVFTVNHIDTNYGIGAVVDVVNNNGAGGTHLFCVAGAGSGALQPGTNYVSYSYTNISGSQYKLSLTVADGSNFSFMFAKVTLVFQASNVTTLVDPAPLSRPVALPN